MIAARWYSFGAIAIVAAAGATVVSAQEAVPYRPVPPGGAAYTMQLPPLQADGQRTTINSDLDDNSTLWHFRSAWNVAALNCLEAGEASILEGYSAFLRKYARNLAAANAALDQRFVRDRGSRAQGIAARESYMTQVYNYFALPPAQNEFCTAAQAIATDFLAAPPADAHDLAAAGLQRFEAVFQDFYRQYQQYEIDSAAWDREWGALYGSSQPGYVAVHGALGPSVLPAAGVAAPADASAVPAIQSLVIGERG